VKILHSADPIADYMERNGLSQRAFANLIGVSQAAVSQWLTGARGMDIRSAELMQRRTKGQITVRALYPKLFEQGA
jgi:predicted transcriptional regulator